MTRLVNIASAHENPVYINAEEVTAIIREGDSTYCFSPAGRFVIQAPDIDVIATALAQAGHDFLILRGLTPHEKPETILVSPRALTFATVSQADTDNNVGVLFGIKGLGRHDISMPERDWYTTLAVMQQSNRPLFSYSHEQAWARWTRPQELHIYPDSITRISGNGSDKQLDVFFEGSGSLDIQVATVGQKHDMLQERYQLWRKQNPTLNINDEKIFGPAARQLEQEVEEQLRARRSLLAHQLALSCGKLLVVQDGKADIDGPLYMKPEDIDLVLFGENGTPATYYLHFEKAEKAGDYRQHVTASFNDRAARDAAFVSVQQQIAARTQASARRANTSKKR